MGRVLTGYATARIAAVVTVGMLVLAGCTGANADPTPSGSAASSGSQTPSSSPTSPSTATATSPNGTASVIVPAAARVHTDEGAKAFARFYLDAVSESGQSADSTTLKAITEPTCKGCQVFIDFADELKAQKQHVDRKSMRLNSLAVRPDSTSDLVVIDCLVEDQPSKILNEEGAIVSNEPGEKLALRNSVKWTGDRWLVAESLLVEGS